MKAKDINLRIGEKDYRLGDMSKNDMCRLIIQLINERNKLLVKPEKQEK